VAASDGHPFRQVVYDLWRLKTSKWLAMSWSSSILERPDSLLVFFFKGHYLVSFQEFPHNYPSFKGLVTFNRVQPPGGRSD
jgi:hypothetical protein